jgi:TRAP-type C4-dicarboxylate transport system permease small subunit
MIMRIMYAYICKAEAMIARTLLIVMVLLVFGAGIAREMAHPINWAVDMATCMFAWACFFCADIAWRKNKLMSVEVLTNYLPARALKYCRMFNYCVLTVFLLYVIGAGLWLSYISRARSFQGIPDFSYSWITLSMPVGAFLLLITTTLKVRDEISGSIKAS